MFSPSAFCLFPPIIVLMVALISRNVFISLLVGLFSASYIATGFDFVSSILLFFRSLINTLDLQNIISGTMPPSDSYLTLFTFIICLGIVIVALQKSGATYAFGAFIRKYVNDKRDVERISLVLSTLFFIDDYFSSLSVGSIMHPITDRFKIARAKLAFLIDAMAAPLAILCPFSTWVGVIIGFLQSSRISTSAISGTPFWIFIQLIPYLFYSFIIMFSAWYIVSRRISYGSMAEHETYSQLTGDCRGNKVINTCNKHGNAGVFDFSIVWLFLVTSLIVSMLYFGDFFNSKASFISALQNTNINMALLGSGITSVILSILYLLFRRVIKFSEIFPLIIDGSKLMKSAIFILILAWSLGSILRADLHIGEFIAGNVISNINNTYLPLTIFLIASSIAFATGSSWGTAALLFPMVMPALSSSSESITILLPSLGALLSGCVAGDHISPISDTTIMTSTSTNMPHIEHVRTQIIYALPCIFSTAIAFLLVTIVPPLISFSLSIAINISILEVLNKLYSK